MEKQEAEVRQKHFESDIGNKESPGNRVDCLTASSESCQEFVLLML